ncbi:uncharacterized protein LOC122670916 [Telopea speciosissima]|uniref:uncharacterized protein LOC122670916 n=1 Tax=Telopea speciosissima TaxID=54955 RepID=UPI001CC6CFEB|nr:uncharacterized protein LOC122670916 [Telopea speciosissima]
MEERPSVHMERTCKIIRRSIYTFLKNYQYFTTTAAVIVFPASASILLSQSLGPLLLPLFSIIQVRLQSLFCASGFPPSSKFISLLNLKLSQTLCSSILSIPFTLSFLLLAKACVIDALQPYFSSFLSLYVPLLITHLCNSFIILSANAVTFSLLFLVFSILDVFGFSSPNILLVVLVAAAIFYSVILANSLVVCNLSLVVAGMENCSGFLAILKACMLIRGRASTALSLALPVNLGLAFVEALFQYRIVRVYNHSDRLSHSILLEGMFIAYLYSLFILLDTIANCMLFKSFKSSSHMDPECRYFYPEEILGDEDCSTITYSKNLLELP